MPDAPNPEVTAARQQVSRLNAEKKQTLLRIERDQARVKIIDAQLTALAGLAIDASAPAPSAATTTTTTTTQA